MKRKTVRKPKIEIIAKHKLKKITKDDLKWILWETFPCLQPNIAGALAAIIFDYHSKERK
jgi:hypothetical protein